MSSSIVSTKSIISKYTICNIPGPAQKETQVQEAQVEETLDITSLITYKRRSFPRVQPQERQQAKPCLNRTPPPPRLKPPAPSPASQPAAMAYSSQGSSEAASLIQFRASN
ncbi:hypothetical protein Bca52824_087124 [Brassica carinata]|uniref:Uncharacterized protein n=1 Tax=Brassica carinata TaxID=52824 RepID=A0A8X7P940_BRACI|nr:hypothetical protein Bca52824_087124 [Brassica carinata]